MSVISWITLALLLLSEHQAKLTIMPIVTSDAIMVAQIIARDEVYDIRDTKTYYFDSLDKQATPVLEGYTSIMFYIDGSVRSTISISNTTGQALDMNGCEIFDYPELRSFQEDIIRINQAKRKSPQELADVVGCRHP